jgi:hypothetical protein
MANKWQINGKNYSDYRRSKKRQEFLCPETCRITVDKTAFCGNLPEDRLGDVGAGQAVFRKQAEGFEVVLIDCITLWVNNLLFSEEGHGSPLDDHRIGILCNEWLETSNLFAGTVICVTNEVGLGIVPDNALARRYRDLVGTCNQLIGKNASEVILVSCGIPLVLTSANEKA